MARSKETFGKKEREKKRLRKRKDKEEKKAERKAEAENSGSSLDEMMVYLDEFGNFTDTPPDENAKKKEIDVSKIQLGAAVVEEFNLDEVRKGKIDFFNHEKGFGFIIESETSEKYFVHINNVKYEGIDAGHKVNFQLEEGFKGLSAINVKKLDLKKEAEDKAAAKAKAEAAAAEAKAEAGDKEETSATDEAKPDAPEKKAD